MDNITVTEQTLKSFKTDILISVKKLIRDENIEHEKKLAELLGDIIKNNHDDSDKLTGGLVNIRAEINRISEKVDNARGSLTGGSNGSNEIADANIVRLLETFKQSMNEAAVVQAKANETEVEKYIGKFTECFSKITEDMSVKMNEAFISGADRLAEKFNISATVLLESMEEKNRTVLKEVQQENNNELQRLAESLKFLAEENNNFRDTTSRMLAEMDQNINSLIEVSKDTDKTIRSHLDDAVHELDEVFEKRISNMVNALEKQELQNAEQFSKAMKDYRDEFIKASADAVASVQSDMISKMEETQEQISTLASGMDKYIASASEYDRKSQSHIDEIKNMYDQIMNSVDKKIGSIEVFIKNNFNDILKEMNDNVYSIKDIINKDLSKTLEEYTGELGEAIGKKLEDLKTIKEVINNSLKITNNLSNQVQTYTSSYNAVIKQVEDDHKKSFELSKKDAELLEGMIRKL